MGARLAEGNRMSLIPSSTSILDASKSGEQLPSGWNVLATAKDREQHRLAKRLRRFGDFHWTAFRGLLAGRVEDHEAFFAQLMRCEEAQPGFLDPVARIIPVTRTFVFRPETLVSQLEEAIRPWAADIDGHAFHVRCERRGHAGLLHGHEVERALHDGLQDWLRAQGHQPHVDFTDPVYVIAVELVGDVCGIGLITKNWRARFPFIRIS